MPAPSPTTALRAASPEDPPRGPAAHRAATRRVMLTFPVVAMLAAAGCTGSEDEQTGAEGTGAEPTIVATVTPPVETFELPREGQPEDTVQDERAAAAGFDRSNCATELSGRAIADQTIAGTVQVRDGQTCVLSDLTVAGDIDVHVGGRLEARDIRATGDIDAEGHAFVLVSGGEVTGSIELERGGESLVENVRIGGDLESEQNSGTQRVEGNTIGGDLECQDNTRSPIGGDNQVSGERQGQCAGL
ncbi:hypothetical protein [Dietzia sp. PP-33]|jgi:hypothetical protein|uniref:hypothetical protein n=1 Tax=Dietzia sp. PP-33 TaxID=2957500 RepID=UPI0029BC39DA|nr:hypothetical protein [Dietzia sp. PP-33]MDX2357716.1 hypothetical protein [Dietzia sp. PP-33]